MRGFVLIISIIFCVSAQGQTGEDWTMFKSSDGVEFYKKEIDCFPENIPNQTGILIKLVNTNNYAISAEWDLRIWYNEKEQTANIKDDENHIVVNIPRKKSIEGNCDLPNGPLYIFKKFITFSGGSVMTNFQFDSVIVKKKK